MEVYHRDLPRSPLGFKLRQKIVVRFYHKPLTLEIRQPLPTFTTPNKITLITLPIEWSSITTMGPSLQGGLGGMPTESFAALKRLWHIFLDFKRINFIYWSHFNGITRLKLPILLCWSYNVCTSLILAAIVRRSVTYTVGSTCVHICVHNPHLFKTRIKQDRCL